MYRELIQKYTADNEYIKINEPATREQIANAEKAIGYRFPDELVSLLLELNGDCWLLFSAGDIAENTLGAVEALKECYSDIDTHIFFAGNGCGDYYCYNILPNGTVDGSTIYIWEHEDNQVRPVARNIYEMISRYYNCEI